MRPISLLFACLMSSTALAADYYLESPELDSKADAERAADAAEDAGLSPRVVRRLGQGSGWRYVVRVEGLTDGDAALDVAGNLADAMGESVGVYAVERGAASLVEEVAARRAAPAAATTTARRVTAPASADVEDALPYLERASKEHKVDGLDLDHHPVEFGFRRLLTGGGVADHLYASRDDALYVEVKPVSGDVVGSRLKIIDDQAWLSVDGGPWTEQNIEKARQTARSMGPTKVLPFVLVLDAAMETRRELLRMETAGRADVDGVEVDVLDFAGDQAAGPVRVEVGVDEPLVHRVAFDAGALVYWFSGHDKIGSFVLPREVVTERDGTLVDRVEIQTLEVGGKMPSTWFATP